jgi:accessory colonization factor AcfC
MAAIKVPRPPLKSLPRKVQALYFKDAGHVIAPGAPNNITELTTSDGTTIVLGGNPTANQSAHDASLEAMVELFKAPVCRRENK